MSHISIIHSFVERHLDWFQFLTIMNRTAKNMDERGLCRMLWVYDQESIARSYGRPTYFQLSKELPH